MKCLYHSDADGWCAGYWVSKYYKNTNENDFIMVDYGYDLDFLSKIHKDELVVIVDFSLELDVMRNLLKRTSNVIWIDHHQSAIKKYKDFEIDIPGIRYDGIAASVLTYCYFFKMGCGRNQFDPQMQYKAPWFTKYIGDYDIWKYEYGEETSYFKLGLDSLGVLKPTDWKTWSKLYYIEEITSLIDKGEIISDYRDAVGDDVCNAYGFEFKIDNITIFCLNSCMRGSNWFVDRVEKYKCVCAFLYDGANNQWEYSFYSDKKYIDCSKIAESAGKLKPGIISYGGHLGAAGLQHKQFIFK